MVRGGAAGRRVTAVVPIGRHRDGVAAGLWGFVEPREVAVDPGWEFAEWGVGDYADAAQGAAPAHDLEGGDEVAWHAVGLVVAAVVDDPLAEGVEVD